jgi:hypothetical protein
MEITNSGLAAIVIPVYKPTLSALEMVSITQCFSILSAYPIIAVKPEKLNLDVYDFKFDKVVEFPNEYFEGVAGYNKLMLSASFYEKFLTYKYILIHQPDAFVFRDDLRYWCDQDHDFIGAPWLRSKEYANIFKKTKHLAKRWLHTKLNKKQQNTDLPTEIQRDNRVGNGGFSLRKTAIFHQVCLNNKAMIDQYNSRSEHQYNEDIYFGLEANRKQKQLNIPDFKKAVFFSMETQLEYAFRLTGGKLPFGCHAWDIHQTFWAPIIAQSSGIDILSLDKDG